MRCDYKECRRPAYAEVYPIGNSNKGWSYLCKKHYKQESEKYGDEITYLEI